MKETDLEGKKIIRKSEDETKEERECDIEIKRESERLKVRKKVYNADRYLTSPFCTRYFRNAS